MASSICAFRSVDGDGHIVCDKIRGLDRDVDSGICGTCPARACNCEHLRFSLLKSAPATLIVRYGNGHTEVWEGEPPSLSFLQAACAEKMVPISAPQWCASCELKAAVRPPEERQEPEKAAPSIIQFPAASRAR